MFLNKLSNLLFQHLRKLRLRQRNLSPMCSVQKVSDAQFLKLLNSRPVIELVEKGQINNAKQILIEHYRNRFQEEWLKPPERLTDLRLNLNDITQEALIDRAESILENQLTHTGDTPLYKGNRRIDWTNNPTNNREWLFRLNRHQWWAVLGLAYEITKDERYAKTFVSQMLDWIDSNPPPKYKDETSPTWRLMEVALRLRISWIPVFSLFFTSPSFTEEAKVKMLRGIYDHARFLSLFQSKLNHLIREANGLACVGIYFPEFQEAQSWCEIALKRLQNELRRQVNQDGSQIEVSTGYQWLVIDEFEQTYDLLKNNKIGLPNEDLSDWLERMYHVLVRLIRPDGSFPEINDGFVLYARDRLMRAGEKLGRKDFIFVGTGGKQGTAPTEASSAIRDAGIYIMRSDWYQDARYLLFDAGPYGGFHGHEDKLNIEVFAYGQRFIVDSGSYTYEKTDPYRKYFVGSQGHNTVLVDGLSQIRRWSEKHMIPKVTAENYATWISSEDFDYVEAVYNEGYAEFELKRPKSPQQIDDVVHLRRVLFVKPDYWVVIDELRGEKAHDYQLIFHCPPEIAVRQTEKQALILGAQHQAPVLHMVPASPQDTSVSWLAGEENPIQGWYSLDHHRKAPSPAIIYEACGCVTKIFITLLYPLMSDNAENKPTITRLNVLENEAVACMVETEQQRDYLLFSKCESTIQFGPYESDAVLAGIRTGNNGTIKKQFEWKGEDGFKTASKHH